MHFLIQRRGRLFCWGYCSGCLQISQYDLSWTELSYFPSIHCKQKICNLYDGLFVSNQQHCFSFSF